MPDAKNSVVGIADIVVMPTDGNQAVTSHPPTEHAVVIMGQPGIGINRVGHTRQAGQTGEGFMGRAVATGQRLVGTLMVVEVAVDLQKAGRIPPVLWRIQPQTFVLERADRTFHERFVVGFARFDQIGFDPRQSKNRINGDG